MAKKLGGLGKGLNAIFIENDSETEGGTVTLKISEIEPNRTQPRKGFDEQALSELAESISQHGLLQPLLVRPLTLGGYQIVAGERRYRASRMAGLTEVPVIIKELTDTETMEIALIENLQREDLSPVEEALGYKALIDEHGYRFLCASSGWSCRSRSTRSVFWYVRLGSVRLLRHRSIRRGSPCGHSRRSCSSRHSS